MTAIDVALSPFDASAADLLAAARTAEAAGFDGVWTMDHLTGSVVGRRWSRDPFVTLGAVAAVTSRVRVGPLVANVMNRHVTRLTSAMATLQSLSGGRAVLGLGAGAAPGSRWAAEHEAIGTRLLATGAERRVVLAETVSAYEALWRGESSIRYQRLVIDGMGEVVGPEPPAPVILGASGPAMVDLALDIADGVNLNLGSDHTALLARIARAGRSRFETSLLARPDDDGDLDYARYRDLAGLDRLVILVTDPSDTAAIERLGGRLVT